MRKLAGVCAMLMAFGISAPQAQEVEETATNTADESPFYRGVYIAPMASYLKSDADLLDDGFGGVLAAGYRLGWYALEFSAVYHSVSTSSSDARELGGSLNGLVFPFSSLPNLFLIGQVGGVELQDYPSSEKPSLALTTFGGGLGYLFPFALGNYEFGLRAEAVYRYGIREENHKPEGDFDAPKNYGDILVNVGLQLPMGLKKAPPPAEPVQVVPVVQPLDSDGDGVTDDLDRCPGTPAGSTVDAQGCLPKPPCKSPGAGERITLAGCGAGDVVVLHGVNFEFDKARLTPNAKTILDNVADELKANPEIQVELGGYTDSRGSDAYNQKLSESRAQSVRSYLVEAGIADSRVTATGYGETAPVADNETEEGRELNRRVELKVTQGAETPAAANPAEDAAAAVTPAPETAPVVAEPAAEPAAVTDTPVKPPMQAPSE